MDLDGQSVQPMNKSLIVIAVAFALGNTILALMMWASTTDGRETITSYDVMPTKITEQKDWN